jgi:hypothetical protein
MGCWTRRESRSCLSAGGYRILLSLAQNRKHGNAVQAPLIDVAPLLAYHTAPRSPVMRM